jgi:hypothetical protein
MTVTKFQSGMGDFLAVKNIAGTGQIQYGRGGTAGIVDLWIIPKSKKNPEEVVSQLEAVPFILNVSVVSLSKPVTNTEVTKARELLNSLGWDTSAVGDEDLSLYLNAKLQGKWTYLLDITYDTSRKVEKLQIIKAEEHPLFSAELIEKFSYEEEILDRELTMDDFETEVVKVKLQTDPPSTPPPPHEAEGNQSE